MSLPVEPEQKSTPKKAKWCSSCEAIFIGTLKKEAQNEKMADSGWKQSTWPKCVADLQGSELICGGAPKKPSSCRDHWSVMKGQAKYLKKLRGLSGFGWDDDAKCVTAPDSVWDPYIAAHPEAAMYRTKRFPLYDEVMSLIEGHYATGNGAFAILEFAASDDDEPELEDTQVIPWEATDREDNDEVVAGVQGGDSLESVSQVSAVNATPAKSSDKRKRSVSPPPSILKRNRSQRFPEIEKLASALNNVATALGETPTPTSSDISSTSTTDIDISTLSTVPPSTLNTPQRKRLVIHLIETEDSINLRTQARALRLIRQERGVVDNFLEIGSTALRFEYLHEELDNF